MKGHWTSHVLAEILRDLYFEERSGSLVLSHGENSRTLLFDRGMLQFAHGSCEQENLPSYLRVRGLVDPDVLDEFLKQPPSATELPQALLHQGFLDKSRLDTPIRDLVRKAIETVFAWPEGLYQFKEGWLLKDVFDSNVLFTFETILKGIGKMADFNPVMAVLASLERPIGVNPSIFLPVEKLGLTANEGYVLSRVDGKTAIRDIVALLPPGMEEATYRFLYGVLVLGMVQFEPPEPGARLFSLRELVDKHRERQARGRRERTLIRETYLSIRSQPPHEVLGLPAQASAEEVKNAYEALSKQFEASAFLPEVQQEFKEEIQIIESRLVEAFLGMKELHMKDLKEQAERKSASTSQKLNLDDFTLRRELNKTENKASLEERQARAQEYHHLARKAFREANYQDCITYCKEAIRYDAQAAYHCLLADTQVLNPDKRWQRQAEENYQRAIELDPWNPDFLVALARLYRGRGLRARARKALEKALEITPNHSEGLAELERVETGSAPEAQPAG